MSALVAGMEAVKSCRDAGLGAIGAGEVLRMAFNGSTARSPWYRPLFKAYVGFDPALQWVHGSLAVVSFLTAASTSCTSTPSMGPRLARRGIVPEPERGGAVGCLQWVHGSLAVVSLVPALTVAVTKCLQWVHGSLAVVSQARSGLETLANEPSMGPRLARRGIDPGLLGGVPGGFAFNGSTARAPWYRPVARLPATSRSPLQWVHGSRAVVSLAALLRAPIAGILQWVHGSRAVVSGVDEEVELAAEEPSMGPRLARRGIASTGKGTPRRR